MLVLYFDEFYLQTILYTQSGFLLNYYLSILLCDHLIILRLNYQAALTYAEAQMRIDDTSVQDELTLGLRRLNSLAKILKRKRINNG